MPKHAAVFRFSITMFAVFDGFLLVLFSKTTVGNKEKLINRETDRHVHFAGKEFQS
jgi:hypothetical protein